MTQQFAITFEDVTPESAELGDADARGFEFEDADLRTAMSYLRNVGAPSWCEANCCPVSVAHPPRWFTFYGVEEDFATGCVRSLSLHLPKSVTGSSAMRLARLLNCHGVR